MLKVAKSSFISNFENLPNGFLLAVGLIILFETALGIIPDEAFWEPPYEQAMLAMKSNVADRPNDFHIIILGDCTGWSSIRPLDLEKALHKKAFNFCVNGAQTYLMNYILLRRYLSHSTRLPDIVIVQLSASAMLWPWGMNEIALRDYILPWFRVDNDFMQELPVSLQKTCLHYKRLQYVPSLRNQFFLRKGFWPLWLWRSDRAAYDRYLKYYEEQKGFYNEDMDPTKRPIEKIVDIEDHYKKFAISEYNSTYVRKIIELLMSYNVRVVICLTPVRDDEMLLWQGYNLRSKLNEKIRELFLWI